MLESVQHSLQSSSSKSLNKKKKKFSSSSSSSSSSSESSSSPKNEDSEAQLVYSNKMTQHNRYISKMFTEKSLFSAANEYHKFDKNMHMQHNRMYVLTQLDSLRTTDVTSAETEDH